MFHTYLIHLTQSIQATWLLIRRQETNDNAAFVFLFDFIFHNVMCSVDSDLALELHKFWIRLIIISLRSVREADRGGQSWCWFHLIVSSLHSRSSLKCQGWRIRNTDEEMLPTILPTSHFYLLQHLQHLHILPALIILRYLRIYRYQLHRKSNIYDILYNIRSNIRIWR